jgi:hypothetical protein
MTLRFQPATSRMGLLLATLLLLRCTFHEPNRGNGFTCTEDSATSKECPGNGPCVRNTCLDADAGMTRCPVEYTRGWMKFESFESPTCAEQHDGSWKLWKVTTLYGDSFDELGPAFQSSDLAFSGLSSCAVELSTGLVNAKGEGLDEFSFTDNSEKGGFIGEAPPGRVCISARVRLKAPGTVNPMELSLGKLRHDGGTYSNILLGRTEEKVTGSEWTELRVVGTLDESAYVDLSLAPLSPKKDTAFLVDDVFIGVVLSDGGNTAGGSR